MLQSLALVLSMVGQTGNPAEFLSDYLTPPVPSAAPFTTATSVVFGERRFYDSTTNANYIYLQWKFFNGSQMYVVGTTLMIVNTENAAYPVALVPMGNADIMPPSGWMVYYPSTDSTWVDLPLLKHYPTDWFRTPLEAPPTEPPYHHPMDPVLISSPQVRASPAIQ